MMEIPPPPCNTTTNDVHHPLKLNTVDYHPTISKSVFPRPEQNVHTPEFFFNTQNHFQLYRMIERTKLRATIHVSVDRGFFREKGTWTCYRRNYFQLNGLVSLNSENSHLPIQDDHPETGVGCFIEDLGDFFPVRRFYLQVSASTQHNHLPVELVQHTPQRDKGPKYTPSPREVRPTSQSITQGSSALFERLQFKRATANNGKRRSTQQFFVLSMDLLAELNDGSHRIIATAVSDKIVVRGRSPGHYSQSEQAQVQAQLQAQAQAQAQAQINATDNQHHYLDMKYRPSHRQAIHPYAYNMNYNNNGSNLSPANLNLNSLPSYQNSHPMSSSVSRPASYKTLTTDSSVPTPIDYSTTMFSNPPSFPVVHQSFTSQPSSSVRYDLPPPSDLSHDHRPPAPVQAPSTGSLPVSAPYLYYRDSQPFSQISPLESNFPPTDDLNSTLMPSHPDPHQSYLPYPPYPDHSPTYPPFISHLNNTMNSNMNSNMGTTIGSTLSSQGYPSSHRSYYDLSKPH